MNVVLAFFPMEHICTSAFVCGPTSVFTVIFKCTPLITAIVKLQLYSNYKSTETLQASASLHSV